MGRFDGRTMLVTGAASGIGEATVERLLDDGAHVVGVDLEAPERDDAELHRRRGRRQRRRRRARGIRDRRGDHRPARRRHARRRRRRWGTGPPARARRVGSHHADQLHRHVPGRPTRHPPDAGAGAHRRRAGVDRERRQHRGHRGHRRRERLQRVEGGRRHPDQEHGHRLRPSGHQGQRAVSRASSTRPCSR